VLHVLKTVNLLLPTHVYKVIILNKLHDPRLAQKIGGRINKENYYEGKRKFLQYLKKP
jgi:hypothetical protein